MRTRLALAVTLTASLASAESLFDLSARRLNGDVERLDKYRGKVVLVVNTASQCGYTPQYAGLQKLYEENKSRGLVILGFPSNEFGGQEPGTAAEIGEFCKLKFGVSFPMFDKVDTQGASQSPVYAFVTTGRDVPAWNFHKYLVGADGKVVASFKSGLKPEAAELRSAIDAALSAKK